MESSDYETTPSRLKADDAAVDTEKAHAQPESDKQDEPERAMTGFRVRALANVAPRTFQEERRAYTNKILEIISGLPSSSVP